jgi:hypothetical protein
MSFEVSGFGSIKKWGALSDPPLEIMFLESRGDVARGIIHPGFLFSPLIGPTET